MLSMRIIHVLSIAAALSLGIFVLLNRQKRAVNTYFFVFSLIMTGWLTCLAIAFYIPREAIVETAIRFSSILAAFAPFTFSMMRKSILKQNLSGRDIFLGSRLEFMAPLGIAVLAGTPLYLQDVVITKVSGDAISLPEPVYGKGINIYAMYFIAYLCWLTYTFARDIRKCTGIQRVEMQFLALGGVSGILIAITTAVLLPILIKSSQSIQFAPLSAFFLEGIVAYGIATRRIMAVEDILRRFTAYALLTLYLAGLYAAVWLGIRMVLKPWVWNDFFAHLVAALAVAFSMSPASGRLQQFANRLFVNVQSLDATEMLRRANRIIGTITTSKELLHQFAEIATTSAGTDYISIYFRNGGCYHQVYPSSDHPHSVFDSTNALVTLLASSDEPLSSDTLQRHRTDYLEQQALREMERVSASLAIGIYAKEELKGFVLLGSRLSGRIYGAAEQSALQVLCNQLAVGMENADLYTQVKDSSIYNDLLVDSVVTGIIAANHSGLITTCNREAYRLLKLPAGSLNQQPIEKLPRPLASALRAALEANKGSRNIESTIKVAGDESLPVRFSTAPFSSHTGKQLGALLVMEDLTTLKKLEAQIRRTDRLASIGTLSAGMAHEIKNPLVTLKTFTQLLPERYQDADFRDTFSSLVGQEVKRIDSIVNQLLRFARPAKPSLHPTRIHEVLDNTLRLVHQQLKQKHIQLVREYEAPNDLIQGDNDLLVQAFLNFFLNAIDAMDREGTLTVRTEITEIDTNQLTFDGGTATEPRLRIAIRDTGVGIKPEDIPHVFDPFFTTKSTGTGLGLSVAHGIIQEHRGIIDVESTPGVGATFFILFPIAVDEVTA